MNTFRSEANFPIKKSKDSLGSSLSDESGSANLLSTSCSSSFSSSLTPSRQLLLESTSENMDVIKEFRNLFLEKYLEKNKIGRRSKLTSKHRNQKSNFRNFSEKTGESGNKNQTEFLGQSGKEDFDKFQIEFFNNDLLDVKTQSYSLGLSSYDDDTFESLNKMSNSYTGNYETCQMSYYNPYYEPTHKSSGDIFSNSLPLNNVSYSSTGRYCVNKNSFENELDLRSFGNTENMRQMYSIENENYRLSEDDNKIFNLEIENPHNNGLFVTSDCYTELSSIF